MRILTSTWRDGSQPAAGVDGMGGRASRLSRVGQLTAAGAFLIGGLSGGRPTGDSVVFVGFCALLVATVLVWPSLRSTPNAARGHVTATRSPEENR